MNTPSNNRPELRTWRHDGDDAPCCEPYPLIETHALSVCYGEKVALRDVSLAINRGCVTAIVGPSGCGKTSFLHALNRLTDLVPGCRVGGSILLDGRAVAGNGTDVVALRRRVGMIFQTPAPFPFSIRRNIDLPLREHGIGPRDERQRIIEHALRDVGLWDEVCDRLDSPAAALSGGQQQRLCIARALALTPRVILCDEPCSALDPMSSATVEDLIASLRGRYTVVVVTHNLAQARRIADHVAVFWTRDGASTLVETGTAEQIFRSPRDELTAAYIGGMRG